MVNYLPMKRVLLALALTALVACGGGDSDEPQTSDGFTPADVGVPADLEVEEITTPEGDVVFLGEDTIYGTCEVMEPHQDDLAGWLGREPESEQEDFAFACFTPPE